VCVCVCARACAQVLSFRLGENEETMYLPLGDLVINDRPSGKPRVCINPTDSYALYRSDQVRDLLYFPKIRCV